MQEVAAASRQNGHRGYMIWPEKPFVMPITEQQSSDTPALGGGGVEWSVTPCRPLQLHLWDGDIAGRQHRTNTTLKDPLHRQCHLILGPAVTALAALHHRRYRPSTSLLSCVRVECLHAEQLPFDIIYCSQHPAGRFEHCRRLPEVAKEAVAAPSAQHADPISVHLFARCP